MIHVPCSSRRLLACSSAPRIRELDILRHHKKRPGLLYGFWPAGPYHTFLSTCTATKHSTGRRYRLSDSTRCSGSATSPPDAHRVHLRRMHGAAQYECVYQYLTSSMRRHCTTKHSRPSKCNQPDSTFRCCSLSAPLQSFPLQVGITFTFLVLVILPVPHVTLQRLQSDQSSNRQLISQAVFSVSVGVWPQSEERHRILTHWLHSPQFDHCLLHLGCRGQFHTHHASPKETNDRQRIMKSRKRRRSFIFHSLREYS